MRHRIGVLGIRGMGISISIVESSVNVMLGRSLVRSMCVMTRRIHLSKDKI